LSSDEIAKMLQGYDNDVKGFKRRLLEACWYMRGGITYGEMLEMGVNDVPLIEDIVKDNLEVTKKSGMPFF
jgi:hypothetical protein